ncbi:MAG: 2-phospho-L-lactate transferase [Anaerolineales bacterium]
MNVVALAGGVGGAKLAHGLAQILPPESLTVVVNTGDDFEHLGLHISPDLDTVMYTLAGLANPATGWGQRDETWNFMNAVEQLNGPTWFRLGDRDLATHVTRMQRLRAGETLTQITAALCAALGVRHHVLPMSDEPVPTQVITDEGPLDFQDYFVRRKCEPRVRGVIAAGATDTSPSPEVMAAIDGAEVVVICPSNPFLSVDPILSLRGLRRALERKLVIAVSPIVGGQAIKGPAAKMLGELGLEVSATAVAQHYARLLTGFVLDSVDAVLKPLVRSFVPHVLVTDTVMRTEADRAGLARQVLAFAATFIPGP